jgi:hypothetical protein
MYAFYTCSDGKVCGDGLDNLIYEGCILFVCISIVGAVYVDFYLSGVILTGIARFATYFFPIIIPTWISIDYILIHMNIISRERFSVGSTITMVTIVLSSLYVLLVKANLYMQEELKRII